ncbi:MAG: transcription elongation factor GreA [Chloroflexi bacterium]|nr:transcription elongation factor GreA [Chloroflexota bacterium]
MTLDAGPERPRNVTLHAALDDYMKSLKPDQRFGAATSYVERYVDRVGRDFMVSTLSGSRVEGYAEQWIKPTDPAAGEQVQALKAWFAFLKKKNYTVQNFGIHIRVRKVAGRTTGSEVRLEEAPVEMTAEGLDALRRELDELNTRKPELVFAITTAREDKDFRENAPLDAAREALAFHEQRVKQIETALKRAVVVETSVDDKAVVGSMVTVERMDTGIVATYKLVSANEANAAEKKISVESPVGKQLLGKRAGDEVQVAAPSGAIEYRVKAVVQP